jgi:hypothetical protein
LVIPIPVSLKDKGIVGSIRDDLNFEARFILDDFWISQRFISDLVKSIGSIGDQFSQENFLVGVEGVDDQTHELLNISIESKVLDSCVLSH